MYAGCGMKLVGSPFSNGFGLGTCIKTISISLRHLKHTLQLDAGIFDDFIHHTCTCGIFSSYHIKP